MPSGFCRLRTNASAVRESTPPNRFSKYQPSPLGNFQPIDRTENFSLKKPKLGIVGATGAVGQEILSLLSQRQFPFKQIKALASARSLGKELPFEDSVLTVEEARPEAFRDLDLAIFSAGGDTSRELGPQAVSRGCVVVDNSSAFRMDPTTPLVVPEINPDALDRHNGIVANPNCSTAVALMALCPLHERFGLRRFFCSTYPAVSCLGSTGLVALEEQV